jgi:LPS export ABC transporter protein LptC
MRLLYLAVPAALILVALYFTWQGLQPPPAGSAQPEEPPPRYELTGAQWLRLNLQGEPEFRVQAESIRYYADESARLRTLTVDALGGAASPWQLTAQQGFSPPRERRMQLEGEVTAVGQYPNGAPLTFTADRLWVDLLRRELYTESAVQLHSDFRSATARGLRADFDGERVQLLNDVQVDYVPES